MELQNAYLRSLLINFKGFNSFGSNSKYVRVLYTPTLRIYQGSEYPLQELWPYAGFLLIGYKGVDTSTVSFRNKSFSKFLELDNANLKLFLINFKGFSSFGCGSKYAGFPQRPGF